MTGLDNDLVLIRAKYPSRWTQGLGGTAWQIDEFFV